MAFLLLYAAACTGRSDEQRDRDLGGEHGNRTEEAAEEDAASQLGLPLGVSGGIRMCPCGEASEIMAYPGNSQSGFMCIPLLWLCKYPETDWCRTTIYLFTDSAGRAFGQGMVGVCPALWYLGLSCGAPRLERNHLRSGSFSCLAIDAGVTRGPQFLPHEPLPVGPARELAWASSHDDGVQGQVSLEGEPEDRGLF